jgi:hypothetical protein
MVGLIQVIAGGLYVGGFVAVLTSVSGDNSYLLMLGGIMLIVGSIQHLRADFLLREHRSRTKGRPVLGTPSLPTPARARTL